MLRKAGDDSAANNLNLCFRQARSVRGRALGVRALIGSPSERSARLRTAFTAVGPNGSQHGPSRSATIHR
eukprot:362423-Chlamydomonas_euryale.AAC.5